MWSEDRRETIESNLRLVHACANRFRGRGIEYEDLYQAGCMGLVKAVDAFDTTRGVKFSTYAVPVILGEIKRLFRDGGSVKVSRSLKELSLRLYRLSDQLSHTLGRDPTVSELAAAAGITQEQAAEAITAMQPTVSLTARDENGDEITFDIRVSGAEEEIGDRLSLMEVIDTLEARDKNMILLRYFAGKTQSQTAQVLGMTQVQVSRREKKVLQQMKNALLV